MAKSGPRFPRPDKPSPPKAPKPPRPPGPGETKIGPDPWEIIKKVTKKKKK